MRDPVAPVKEDEAAIILVREAEATRLAVRRSVIFTAKRIVCVSPQPRFVSFVS
jgi:hypothetical protein